MYELLLPQLNLTNPTCVVLLLLLPAVLQLVMLLLQREVELDSESLQDVEQDHHTDQVESREYPPGDGPVVRREPQRLRPFRRVLGEEQHEPRVEGHERVVEVEDEPVVLRVVRALEPGVALVHHAAEEVDAERREEEQADSLDDEDVAGRHDHLADRRRHELDLRVLLQLLEHPEQSEKPKYVCVSTDVTLHKFNGQMLENGRAHQKPRGEEVEAVRAEAPIFSERLDAELGQDFEDVQERERQVRGAEDRGDGPVVQFGHGLEHDGDEVGEEHPVHEGVDVRVGLRLPHLATKPHDFMAVPQRRRIFFQ
mmetsp:Transcript_87598/g.248365  ORF Transcript_87598/g.248365 Transcript_87598/m.248365 type:complete len:311 (+) Transcript_87598:293-1225(+)